MVPFDEAPRLFDRLRRAEPIVQADEIDLAPIHAALIIDHPEIGGFRPTNDGIGRKGPP
jgi:hypothetical protein